MANYSLPLNIHTVSHKILPEYPGRITHESPFSNDPYVLDRDEPRFRGELILAGMDPRFQADTIAGITTALTRATATPGDTLNVKVYQPGITMDYPVEAHLTRGDEFAYRIDDGIADYVAPKVGQYFVSTKGYKLQQVIKVEDDIIFAWPGVLKNLPAVRQFDKIARPEKDPALKYFVIPVRVTNVDEYSHTPVLVGGWRIEWVYSIKIL